jgi:hypothetical protein
MEITHKLIRCLIDQVDRKYKLVKKLLITVNIIYATHAMFRVTVYSYSVVLDSEINNYTNNKT